MKKHKKHKKIEDAERKFFWVQTWIIWCRRKKLQIFQRFYLKTPPEVMKNWYYSKKTARWKLFWLNMALEKSWD